MLQNRIIPCLLLKNKGLVKTVKFKTPKYIGDPINAVKIFNEKEVDELILLDIDATKDNRIPDYKIIEDIVSEAFMPICYGGGVSTIDQMKKLYYCGIEKISLSSAAHKNPNIIDQAANLFGSQSVVITLDIKQSMIGRKYNVMTHNGKIHLKGDPISIAQEMEKRGAGEIMINNIDRDGTMKGYDSMFIKSIVDALSIPVIALGGAGSLDDLKDIFKKTNVTAVAAGSMFVFYGSRRAVLINYPSDISRNMIGEQNDK
jgi:imidazole glycerol-phosphate synthase subunit HisF